MGVVLIKDNQILVEEHNSQRTDNIAVHHAEIKAIINANKLLKNRKLEGVTAYCSCEPCAMCLTALSYAKVSRIVFYKTAKELFPEDPQSQVDERIFIQNLNFVPKLEQLKI